MTRPVGNPQLEHGHTRIANELLEALIRYPFNGGELKIVLAIIRLTYGWRKTERPIKQTELTALTGLHLRYVQALLDRLRTQAVLFRDRTSRPHTYRLNKAYFGWRDWPPELEPVMVTRSAQAACELAGAPAELSVSAPAPWSRVRKEKKEKDLPHGSESAVENLTRFFKTTLQRDLTPDEHDLIREVHALSPLEASQFLEYLAAGTSHQQPTEAPDAHGTTHDSHG